MKTTDHAIHRLRAIELTLRRVHTALCYPSYQDTLVEVVLALCRAGG